MNKGMIEKGNGPVKKWKESQGEQPGVKELERVMKRDGLELENA